MAGVDYAALAATARALVEANGRQVTLRRLEDAPSDVSKPWRGAANPASPADATATPFGVAVPPSSATALGMSTQDNDLVKRSQQIFIITPAEGETQDYSTFHELVDDDGEPYRIVGVEKLRPAQVTLLYFVGVAR
jgi:hypothetical protein